MMPLRISIKQFIMIRVIFQYCGSDLLITCSIIHKVGKQRPTDANAINVCSFTGKAEQILEDLEKYKQLCPNDSYNFGTCCYRIAQVSYGVLSHTVCSY